MHAWMNNNTQECKITTSMKMTKARNIKRRDVSVHAIVCVAAFVFMCMPERKHNQPKEERDDIQTERGI